MEYSSSPSGTYVDSKGRDLYTKQRVVYYVFVVLQVIYMMGILAHFVLIMNANVKHTHTYQNNNGPLYSERFTSMYWYALMFSACRIFLFIASCSAITYRKTSCCCVKRKNRGCAYFWVFFLMAFVILDVFVMATFASFFKGCNVPGNANNPCNDLRYCHVKEVYDNPDSGCTYATPWTPPVTLGELRRDADFLWLFSTSVAFVALDCVLLFVPLGLWISNSVSDGRIDKKEDDVEYEDDFDVLLTDEELQRLGSNVNATGASLRQRNGAGVRRIRKRIQRVKGK